MKTTNLLFSLISIFSMISSVVFHYLMEKTIPWLYITLGSIFYVAIIIIIVNLYLVEKADVSKKHLNKLLLGSHFSYLLIAAGTLLVTGFWGSLGILISSIALGFIPSLVATVLESID